MAIKSPVPIDAVVVGQSRWPFVSATASVHP